MPPDMTKAEARPAPAPVPLPTTNQPTISTSEDSRPRLIAELLAPDGANRFWVWMVLHSCLDCRKPHLSRSPGYSASYERTLPCAGHRQVVLVTRSFHLRQAVA